MSPAAPQGLFTILGGGQLARMTAMAAYRLGLEVGVAADRAADSPAGMLASVVFDGPWADPALQAKVAEASAVITLENEFVDPAVLAAFEARGLAVHPGSHTLSLIQDKLTQKTALMRAGLPVPRFAAVDSPTAVEKAAEALGWPMVLKARTNGYDGYGNDLIRHQIDIAPAWEKLSRRGSPLMVEQFIPFTAELAVMAARNRHGQTVVYPLVQTIQHAHMCHTVLCPAPASDQTVSRAQALATHMLDAVKGVGVFGLELFLMADGELLINEVAPRPHNSGHFSLEACETSQFENHVRAVMGWPLGSARLTVPAAAMVNILGSHDGPALPTGLAEALRHPGASIHLYGKRDSRPGRKLGHVTAVGATVQAARETALAAARAIHM